VTAEATEPTNSTDTVETDEASETQTSTPDRLPDDHPVVKALAKANKEAEQARLKVKEFEDAQKTDQERLSEQLSTLQQERDRLNTELMRERIGRKHGLPDEIVARIQGGDEDEMDADAARLAELFTVQPDEGNQATRRPREALRSGATPKTDTALNGDPLLLDLKSKLGIR
jgi:hypothetical protein